MKLFNLIVIIILWLSSNLIAENQYGLISFSNVSGGNIVGQKFGIVNTNPYSFSSSGQSATFTWPGGALTDGVNLSALGSMGAEGDPITGKFFLRAANPNNSDTEDIVSVSKSDGSTSFLGLTQNDFVVGFDTIDNKLIVRRTTGGANSLLSVNVSNSNTSTIKSGFGTGSESWQAGGVSAVDPVNRTAYVFDRGGGKLYSISLTDGTTSSVDLDTNIVAISFDPINSQMYGIKLNNSFISIDKSTGAETVLNASAGSITSYVQAISGIDRTYIFRAGGDTYKVLSLDTGELLRSFSEVDTEDTKRLIQLFPYANVVIGGTDDSTYTTTITDTQTKLVKVGTGSTSITGTNLHTLGTEIKAGTLSIDGISSQSEVTVDSGATLEGIGTSGTVTNNGTVAPGNSIGTLNIAGNYTQGGSSTLNIEVDTSGNTDKLIISGTAALDGTLRITPSSGSYSSQTFNFLTAGSITGTFSSVVATNCTTPSVTYGSTSLSFTLTCSSSNSTNFDNLTSYFNDLSVSGDLSTVVSAINGLSGSSYNSAIESLDFNHTSASNKLNAQISSSNANFINQRIVALNSSLYSNEIKLASASNVLSDVSYDSFQDLFKGIGQTGSWGTFYGGEKDQNDITDIGVNGYEDSFIGLIFGYDTKSDDQTTGIAFTYQDGEITSDNNEGVSNYKLYAVSPYLHKSIDQQESVTLEASLNIGDFDSKRYLKFGAINRTATSSYDTYGFSIRGSYNFTPESDLIRGDLNNSFGIGYIYSHRDSFSESGANSLNLSVGSSDAHALIANATSSISWDFKNNGDKYLPYSSVGIEIFSYLDNPDTKQNLIGQSKLTTKSDEDNTITGKIKSGVFIDLDNNLFFDAHAGYDLSENASQTFGALKLRKLF